MSDAQALCVVRAQLYLYAEDTGQYADYGQVGCAIMGSTSAPTFKLGCYNDSNEYICTAPITANNETSAHLALQGNGYVCFKDDQGRNWSMLFGSDGEAVEFGAQYTVAMYGAASQPENNIIACDATVGKKDRLIFANDKVKVRYYSWVVQRGFPGRELAKLGSRLETNEHDEKPYMFTVPANHASVTAEMKGFEGMVVGVGEESRRYIVVPQNAKKGSGPNVHMCFMINVLRKKDEPKNGAPAQTASPQQPQQYPYGQMGQMGGVYPGQPFYAGGDPGQHGHPYAAPVSNQLAIAGQPLQQQLTIVEPPVVNQPPPAAPAPPPPPPGFNNEQLQIVDRMRDQIQALQQQLRDATQKLDMFAHDFKVHQQKQKPQSLASAQLEFTIQKLIQDTEDLKEELTQRDTTLRQVEDKNKELQKKVDKFTATANQLAEEKKGAINSSSEEKIDLDRRIAQLQSQLTRVMGEREDVARHLSTVKRLLEVSDQDMKTEKSKLQVALVTFQTNESKLVTTEESLIEERARRKVLESKSITLTDELRGLGEELRTKEAQIEERRRKIESDKLHYNQLMEDERGQAASELRELRQELIDEIAIRDRRYQEERQRVGHESFERGRIQGVEDGHNEALLEADMKIQELVLSVQRNKSEVETMKIRLRQNREQADSDQRRINAQISALTRAVDDLDGQNSATEMEIDSLKNAKNTVEEDTYDRISAALRGLSREVGKRDLLTIIHQLRVHKPIDYSFETERIDCEARRLEDERLAVVEWVRMSINSPQPLQCPPMRTKAVEEKVLPVVSDVAPSGHSGPMTQLPPELAALSVSHEHQRQEDILQFDPEAMNKRYRELLTQLGEENPELGLIEKKPPPKPRVPTPEPPRDPTPPREPTPAAAPQEPTPAREPSPARPEDSQPPAVQQPLPALSSDDEDEQPVAPPAPQPTKTTTRQPPPRQDSEDSDDAGRHRAPAKPEPKKPSTFEDSEDDAPVTKPTAKPATKPNKPVSDDDDEDAAPKQKKPSPPLPRAPEEPESPPPRPVTTKQPAAAKAAKSSVFEDSDSEAAPSGPVASKPAPPKRAAAVAVKKGNAFDDSDEDEGPALKASSAGKPQAKAAAKPATKAKSMFDDSDDDEPAPPPKKAVTATKSAAKKSAPVAKKKSMFDDSD
jgi:hypothetical protein